MGQPINKKEATKTIKAVENALKNGFPPPEVAGNTKSALLVASEALGFLSSSVITRRLKSIEKKYGLTVQWDLWKSPDLQKSDTLLGAMSRENKRLQSENKLLKRRNTNLNKDAEEDDSIKRVCFQLSNLDLTVPFWAIKQLPAQSPGTPMLHVTDLQWGEVVNKNEMDGINEFNSEIAEQRYRRLIEKTIDLCFNHTSNPEYSGIYYLRGGDMVSGDIHEELKETNDAASLPAVKHLVEVEIWGISELAARFGEVHVKSVAGNHGRTTIKPHSKKYAENNYDTLSAYMLEQWFSAKGDKRVTFETAMSADILFELHGWNILLTHGDRMGSRGGMGFIGPAATILRGMKKLRDYYSTLGKSLDYIITGHFHEALDLGYGYAGGSLSGATEYGRDFRFVPRPPIMWLLWVHPKIGIADQRKIFLEDRLKLS